MSSILTIPTNFMADDLYRWRVKTRLPDRKGTLCRVLVRSLRMNSVLVEFDDGYRVVTSAHYVRRVADDRPTPLFDEA